MNPVEIIARKRDGEKLSTAEIDYFISRYVMGELPDYQMSAFLMAYYFQDMVQGKLYYDELAELIRLMTSSGEVTDFSDEFPLLYDKHSTGGVGDKLSFICAPIAAAAGCPSLLLSGRGLGHTGGTLDKMEAVPGVRVNLNTEEIRAALKESGLVITGATANIAPADRKMYALRDVTATVPSVGLIAASILSKKLAVGPTCLVLDVKYGSGAFMKTEADARRLGETMIRTLGELKRPARALLTNMDQPLGRMVGNSMEIRESIDALRGKREGIEDIVDISLELAAHGIQLFKKVDARTALNQAHEALTSGAAFETFQKFFAAQGGDTSVLEDPDLLPAADTKRPVAAARDGVVSGLTSDTVGLASIYLGAGRFRQGDRVDLAAGIEIKRKIGESVKAGDELALLHYNEARVDAKNLHEAEQRIQSAYILTDEAPVPAPLIAGIIDH